MSFVSDCLLSKSLISASPQPILILFVLLFDFPSTLTFVPPPKICICYQFVDPPAPLLFAPLTVPCLGLGSSSAKEAREYFSDMARHKIKFRYGGSQDDHSIQLAFSKKFVEQRKEWLTNWMEEGKRRKELGLPEVYLYEKDTKAVNYTDFVNKELVLFSNMDNERSLPRYSCC